MKDHLPKKIKASKIIGNQTKNCIPLYLLKTDLLIKKFPINRTADPGGFNGEFYQC